MKEAYGIRLASIRHYTMFFLHRDGKTEALNVTHGL